MKIFIKLLKLLEHHKVNISSIIYDVNNKEQECIVMFFGKDVNEFELEITEKECTLYVNNSVHEDLTLEELIKIIEDVL